MTGKSKKWYLLIISFIYKHFIKSEKGEAYPWGRGNYLDRQEDILKHFRDNMIIELNKDIVDRTLIKERSQSEIIIRNLEGSKFSVGLLTQNASSIGSKSQLLMSDKRALIKSLDGLCAFHNRDYWSFEWCHRRDVRQVHVEFSEGRAIRDPDWSLGNYESSVFFREGGEHKNEHVPIIKMIDFFEGGQKCDETGEGRRSIVTFECCPHSHHRHVSSGREDSNRKIENFRPEVFIANVEEARMCEYEITICVSTLCPSLLSSLANNNPGSKENQNQEQSIAEHLSSAMEALQKRCLYRQEDWWMYELCFGTGIRQFHARIDNVPQPNGMIHQQQIIETQFSLGDAPMDIYRDSQALLRATGLEDRKVQTIGVSDSPIQTKSVLPAAGMPVSGLDKTLGPKFIGLEFVGGTECDIERLSRATSVHVSCGPKEMITDIIEDRTCHYNFKVTSPLLCMHSHFAPTQLQTERVVLSAQEPPADAEGDAEDVHAPVDPGSSDRELPVSLGTRAPSQLVSHNVPEPRSPGTPRKRTKARREEL